MNRFKQDICRWIVPEEIADPSRITLLLTIRLLWTHLPLQAMMWYRIGAWCYQKRIRVFPSLFQKFIAIFYGLELSIAQDIGGGLYIPHPFGTVISVAKIGENCTIIHNVTIGRRKNSGFPVIGNNVFVGAGARILGDIVVGDNAVVGANAVVIEGVPPGATVVGVPAKVVRYLDVPSNREISKELDAVYPKG